MNWVEFEEVKSSWNLHCINWEYVLTDRWKVQQEGVSEEAGTRSGKKEINGLMINFKRVL